MKYAPFIWLNTRALDAARRGAPIGMDRYGYLCDASDPLCVVPPNDTIAARVRALDVR